MCLFFHLFFSFCRSPVYVLYGSSVTNESRNRKPRETICHGRHYRHHIFYSHILLSWCDDVTPTLKKRCRTEFKKSSVRHLFFRVYVHISLLSPVSVILSLSLSSLSMDDVYMQVICGHSLYFNVFSFSLALFTIYIIDQSLYSNNTLSVSWLSLWMTHVFRSFADILYTSMCFILSRSLHHTHYRSTFVFQQHAFSLVIYPLAL